MRRCSEDAGVSGRVGVKTSTVLQGARPSSSHASPPFSTSLVPRQGHQVQRPSPVTNHTAQTEVRRPKLSRHTFIRVPVSALSCHPAQSHPGYPYLAVINQPHKRTIIPKQKPGPTARIQETHRSNPTTTLHRPKSPLLNNRRRRHLIPIRKRIPVVVVLALVVGVVPRVLRLHGLRGLRSRRGPRRGRGPRRALRYAKAGDVGDVGGGHGGYGGCGA